MTGAARPIAGTSGWSYPGWRGGFYKGVPRRARLLRDNDAEGAAPRDAMRLMAMVDSRPA